MPMSRTRLAYFGVVIAVVIAATGLVHLRLEGPDEFRQTVRTADFLAGQRYARRGDGCVAMTAMDDVDVVVVGSSVAWSNIEARTLARLLAPQTVAVCGISGWPLGLFEMLFEFFEQQRLTPRRIIWLAEVMSIREVSITQHRLELGRGVFFSNDVQGALRQRWRDQLAETGAPFPIDASRQIELIELQRTALDHLDPTRMRTILDSGEVWGLAGLGRLLTTAQPYPNVDSVMRRICAAVRQRGIAFDIVITPVPDVTQEFVVTLNNPHLPRRDQLYAELRSGMTCARRVVDRDLADWGLDLRNFTNRHGDADFPYAAWESAEAFYSEVDTRDSWGQIDLFDPHHMNLVGSVVFTEALADALD